MHCLRYVPRYLIYVIRTSMPLNPCAYTFAQEIQYSSGTVESYQSAHEATPVVPFLSPTYISGIYDISFFLSSLLLTINYKLPHRRRTLILG